MHEFTFHADLDGLFTENYSNHSLTLKEISSIFGEGNHSNKDLSRWQPHVRVAIYRNSLVATGDNPSKFLRTLAHLFMNLLSKGFLPCGGIVLGGLNFDVEITPEAIDNNYPQSETIKKCISLEHKLKGARIIMENEFAESVLNKSNDWLTLQGYTINPKRGRKDLILERSIAPRFDESTFEILYPVIGEVSYQIIDRRIAEIDHLLRVLPIQDAVHLIETKRLLRHSLKRLEDHNAVMIN
ncbi:MAG: hypothetical protein AB3N14_13600 [Flavobacteriaceae bacterium]